MLYKPAKQLDTAQVLMPMQEIAFVPAPLKGL